MIYLIGSMRNPRIPIVANELRKAGFDIFDDWYSPGDRADEEWQRYEISRGRTYQQALDGAHAWNVFDFDRIHLDAADAAILLAPAGKSAHIELGYMIGKRKPSFVLMEHEPERYDVMLRFATAVCVGIVELEQELARLRLGGVPCPF